MGVTKDLSVADLAGLRDAADERHDRSRSASSHTFPPGLFGAA
jgi:hypothetical protein